VNHLSIEKKKHKNLGLKECSNCGGHEFPLWNCSKCKISSYCGKACQIQHWNDGHKLFCIPFQQRFEKDIREPKNDGGELCMICQASLTSSATMILSCSHVFHTECITDLITFNKLKTCPICRFSLDDYILLITNKAKNIYDKFLEHGYQEKYIQVYMGFNQLEWIGRETIQEKLSLDKFFEEYPFLKITDPDFFFMSGVHSFLRGETKEATKLLLK